MPFSDRPPAMVVPDIEAGRVKLKAMVAEEPSLLGKLAACPDFEYMLYPVYTDSDWLREPSVPTCARRKRDGVRDMNWCCRCLSGFPITLQEKAYEEFSDSPIRL